MAACSAPTDPGQQPSDDPATVSTLVYGAIGGANDTAQPYLSDLSTMSVAIQNQLYEGLTRLGTDGAVEMALAESLEPNDTLDVWTVHLRPNVKKHDGTPFTSDDALWSLDYILDPANAYSAAAELAFVDPAGLKKIDDLTFEIHLNKPYGPFAATLASFRLPMAGKGASADNPIGTGPFKLESADSTGQRYELTRFDDYWDQKPGFEHLTMVAFNDQAALVNALRGGQVDVVGAVPFTEVKALEATPGLDVLVSENAQKVFLSFRVDLPPFDDVRVREAMRLIVDRQQMVDVAFGGFASIANDINGNNTSCPPPDVPQRKQDIAKAKQLLADAGVSDLTVEISTDNGFSGMMEMIQVFAQNAADAGVTVIPNQLDTATFLNKWTEWPAVASVAQNIYFAIPTRYYLAGGGNNTSHWADPEYAEIAAKLYATADPDEQCEYITELQRIEYERGGDVIPVYPQAITVHSEKVKGLQQDLYNRSSYRFNGVTIES
ncbi:MAG: hypothetical protein BGO95_07115 [Micrococcales bacterium 73-13]|nr:MAG: hypothetical protein BGO95_07115 [Micrococcales bacterium 73-13]